jgi:hypothetical protein
MSARATAVSIVLLLAVPGLAAAQGLGDAASQEAQKRAKAPVKKAQPPRTLTNEDLDRVKPAGKEETTEAPAPESGTSRDASPSPGADRAEKLQPYVDAAQEAQSRVDGLEAQIRDMEARLNPMSTSYIYGASSGTAGNLQAEEMRVVQALNRARADLVEARKALSQANERLEDARRGRFTPRPPS